RISGRVEVVVNSLPQAQLTVAWCTFGWIPSFIARFFLSAAAGRRILTRAHDPVPALPHHRPIGALTLYHGALAGTSEGSSDQPQGHRARGGQPGASSYPGLGEVCSGKTAVGPSEDRTMR